jgi:arginine/lysine/ornithine decarboxylase
MGMGFEQGSVFHLQGDLVDSKRLSACADLLMTTSPNVLLYSAIDGWRRQMVRDGERLLGDALELARFVREEIEQRDGMHVLHDELLHEQASHDLDILHVLVDLKDLGITGYQASDWLRENCRIDVGLSDHRRIEATLSMADDRSAADRLLASFDALLQAAPSFAPPSAIDFPSYHDLEVEPVLLPRDAFFGPTESVPAREAIGRVCAEQITPYPPGIPVLIPGERITEPIVDYLQTGLKAGMMLPDPADQSLGTIKVTALP